MSRPQWGTLRRPGLLMRVAIMDAAIEAGTTPTVAASAMREVAERVKAGTFRGSFGDMGEAAIALAREWTYGKQVEA